MAGALRRDYWSALSADRIASVLGHLSDGIAVLGPGWDYLYVDEQAAELLGRSADELIGRRIWDLLTADAALPFRSLYEGCLLYTSDAADE